MLGMMMLCAVLSLPRLKWDCWEGDQFEQIQRSRMLYRPFRLNFLPFHDEFLSGPDFTW